MRKETVLVFLCCRGAFLASHLPIKEKKKTKKTWKSQQHGAIGTSPKKLFLPTKPLLYIFSSLFLFIHSILRFENQLSANASLASCRTSPSTEEPSVSWEKIGKYCYTLHVLLARLLAIFVFPTCLPFGKLTAASSLILHTITRATNSCAFFLRAAFLSRRVLH